jgi:hypothetical protein
MSYIVIKVYSFECDYPGCAVTNCDIEAVRDLREALKDLRRREHWTVKDGKHYCPKHIPGASDA